MSDTFIIAGVKFENEDWNLLFKWFLVLLGGALVIYIALFTGDEGSHEQPSEE